MDDVPSREQIASWLEGEQGRTPEQAGQWAEVLEGLPRRYVEPVVKLAVNSGTHPAVALGMAARYSSDVTFVGAARVHLDRIGGWVDRIGGWVEPRPGVAGA